MACGGRPTLSATPQYDACHDGGFLVIGGGVAGSTCAIELKRLCPSSKVTLVSPASAVKTVRDTEQITPLLGVVDVEESSAAEFAVQHPEISLVCGAVTRVDPSLNQARLASGEVIRFARCCVATGASPSLAAAHPRVIGIRDTESVENLRKRLKDARRVLIVGNGGIALELVHAFASVKTCQVVWAVRDAYIGNTFFDASASAFVLPSLTVRVKSENIRAASDDGTPSLARASEFSSQITQARGSAGSDGLIVASAPAACPVFETHSSPTQDRPEGVPNNSPDVETRAPCATSSQDDVCDTGVGEGRRGVYGAGLGPDWAKTLNIDGRPTKSGGGANTRYREPDTVPQQPLLDVQFECELRSVRVEQDNQDSGGVTWPVWAMLTNGIDVGCDFVVSATGVKPNTDVLDSTFERGSDGGLIVDEGMRVNHASDPSVAPDKDRGDGRSMFAEKPGRRCGDASTSELQGSTIFAAGDCCCLEWPMRESAHWFQLRLWSQARAMGLYAAKCMADCVDELGSGGAFDLFLHATQFFGHKVALLGHYNGQGLGRPVQDFVSMQLIVDPTSGARPQQGATSVPPKEQVHGSVGHRDSSAELTTGSSNVDSDVQVLVRTTPGVEYIKVVLEKGRVRGAMLIGDTGLAETFENLILNATDVSEIGVDLLSLDVDIEDFFD